MNYQEFKDHLITFLWKLGDAQLIASLDNLIQMADNELARKLTIVPRETAVTLTVEAEDWPLPNDFKHMIEVSEPSRGSFLNTTIGLIHDARRDNRGTDFPTTTPSPTLIAKYAIRNNEIMLVGPFSPETPQDISLTYRIGIPDFEGTDTSYLADDFLDLYTYAVLKHSGPFLREDERVPMWVSMFSDALDSVIEEDLWEKRYGGSPLEMRQSRQSY